MKKCAGCDQKFGDDFDFCPNDGTILDTDIGIEAFIGHQSAGEIPTQFIQSPHLTPAKRTGRPSNLRYLVIGFLATALIAVGVLYFSLRNQLEPTKNINPREQNNNQEFNGKLPVNIENKDTVNSGSSNVANRATMSTVNARSINTTKTRVENSKGDRKARKMLLECSDRPGGNKVVPCTNPNAVPY